MTRLWQVMQRKKSLIRNQRGEFLGAIKGQIQKKTNVGKMGEELFETETFTEFIFFFEKRPSLVVSVYCTRYKFLKIYQITITAKLIGLSLSGDIPKE